MFYFSQNAVYFIIYLFLFKSFFLNHVPKFEYQLICLKVNYLYDNMNTSLYAL